MDPQIEQHQHQIPQTVRAVAAQEQWANLCAQYLPVDMPNWNYSRRCLKDDPSQGWKLHIAATVLSANKVLETVAPVLKQRGVLFKGPTSLEELEKLNSGVQYGYSQVGKFRLSSLDQRSKIARTKTG